MCAPSDCFAQVTTAFLALAHHTLQIGAQGLDLGATTPFLWLFEEREKLMSFYEAVSGARLHAAYYRIGGVHQDIPENILDEIFDWRDNFHKTINDIDMMIKPIIPI